MPSTYSDLLYHVVFSTKNRYPFLDADLQPRVHEYLGGIVREIGGSAIRVGGVAEHVHMLIRLKPTHCVADVLQRAKKSSSEWLRETIPKFHWQDGYSAFSVSRSRAPSVDRYIARQLEHHRNRTFADEYRELLRACGIDFDERFLL